MKPEFKHLALILQTAKDISLDSGAAPAISFTTLTEVMSYIRYLEVDNAAVRKVLNSAGHVLKRTRGLRKDDAEMIADLQEQVLDLQGDLIRRNEELGVARDTVNKIVDQSLGYLDDLGEARTKRDLYRNKYEQEKSRADSMFRGMEAQRQQKDGVILACMAIAEGKA